MKLKETVTIFHYIPRLCCRRKGFTVLEIVVSVAVIAILAGAALSMFRKGRETANYGKCNVQLKSIALALDAYRQERDCFPEKLQELLNDQYVQDATLLHCPNDPNPRGTYGDFYMIRDPRSQQDLPVLICPFHEKNNHGVQAYVGRYTTQFMTKPAVLKAANATTVQHPAKQPVAAPVGLQLHGADTLRTAGNGFATVEFADGSIANIQRNSQLTILQSFLEGNATPVLYTLLHQTVGRVDYVVNHGSKFDVSTPVATAGALGTKFRITIGPNDHTTLLVTQGKVRFNNSHRKIPVKVGVPATAHH